MSTTFFFVSKHVHFCFAGDHCVFLDLKKDRYSCLRNTDVANLGLLVQGWPLAQSNGDLNRSALQHVETMLHEMFSYGLVSPDRSKGKDATLVTIPRIESTLLKTDTEWEGPAVSLADAWNFLTAATASLHALRVRGLSCAVHRISRRETRGNAVGRPLDLQEVRNLVVRFNMMRPYFPAKGICLIDSLILTSFLASYNIYPLLVFGVRTEPFHAHCWVQQGNTVFNDNVEHASSYTPIMAV